MASKTTVSLTKTARWVAVRGKVTPSRGGGTVITTLYRKRAGAFVRIAAKTSAVTARGTFAVVFSRPRPGACRVTVRYRGNATHLPSQASTTFRS
jgi:hypothetical protein